MSRPLDPVGARTRCRSWVPGFSDQCSYQLSYSGIGDCDGWLARPTYLEWGTPQTAWHSWLRYRYPHQESSLGVLNVKEVRFRYAMGASSSSESTSSRATVLRPSTTGGRFPHETSKQLQHSPLWSGVYLSSQHVLITRSETSASHLSHLIVPLAGIDPTSTAHRAAALPLS